MGKTPLTSKLYHVIYTTSISADYGPSWKLHLLIPGAFDLLWPKVSLLESHYPRNEQSIIARCPDPENQIQEDTENIF